jgi:serine/threonine-protein kinase SRPK3
MIIKKLGWGHFSTVWLAFSLQDKKLYALKVLKSNKKYLESAFDEEEICKLIADNYQSSTWAKSVKDYLLLAGQKPLPPGQPLSREHTHCLQMYDWFFHHSVNGKHFVMAFEVLGKNLLSLVKQHDYRGIPMPIVREITRQLLMALDYMHRICGLIHTDLKPENITFSLKEGEEFDLMYRHVFSTQLVDLYEREEKIILNKKQAKNQKKKDRKKKKKQGKPTTTTTTAAAEE